jgi:hypothetical protein
MTNTPEPPKLPSEAQSTPQPANAGSQPSAGSRRWLPPARVTAILAAAMLAIGVVVGAAIGPAPSSSFAVGQLLPLLPSLLRAGERTSPAATPPASSPQASAAAETETGRVRRHKRKRKHAVEAAATETTTPTEATKPAASGPTSATKPKASALPPVTKVWLIELGNSSFGEVAANASAAPYITASALPAGTLLGGWSSLEGSAFASEAALAASTPPQLVDTIVQPACPASSPEGEGAAGAACQPDTAGALTSADEFLKATLPTITATAGYRENGLVVITFASITAATESGLPAGAANATLTSQPPAGVLLISPFVTAGGKSSIAFDPTSPKQSLEKLLRR